MNIGEESVYTFNVTDESDSFNVTVMGAPAGSSAVEEDGGTYTFRLTLMKPDPSFILSFLAVDSEGAIAMLSPTVEICGCQNGGNCILDGTVDSDNATIVLNCNCIPQGKEVESDYWFPLFALEMCSFQPSPLPNL